MAVTYEYVGKTGGIKVESLPVDFANPSSNGTYDVISLPIPSGQRSRVVVHLESVEASTIGSISPVLWFGDVEMGSYAKVGGNSFCGAVTGPVTIRAERKSGTGPNSAAFSGTVYYWPTG